MKVIVDTNVPVVANNAAPQASPACVMLCTRRLQRLQAEDVLILDDAWLILQEYKRRLRSSGQPDVGDVFLKWVLTNRANPQRCEQVHITPQSDSFVEFPADPALKKFDISDRKFAAVACAHPEHPPVLNAVDSDWWHYREILMQCGVQVDFLCPDVEFKAL